MQRSGGSSFALVNSQGDVSRPSYRTVHICPAAFERGRSLPRDQIPFIPLKPVILPIIIDESLEEQWPPPSRSAIYFLGDDIAIKLSTQHLIPDIAVDQPEKLLLILFQANFVSQAMEKETFDLIDESRSPHCPNLPLGNTLGSVAEQERVLWACEFVSASSLARSKLETYAWTVTPAGSSLSALVHGLADLLPRPRPATETKWASIRWRNSAEIARADINASLHACITSSPESTLTNRRARWQSRDLAQLGISARKGEYPVHPGAAAIGDILRDAWALKTGAASFSDVAERVKAKLGCEQDLTQQSSRSDYESLKARCKQWIET
ncbi:hypothetical protein B0H66DRAFT_644051 [Apodospora peruviana]|uniref:Uncharacterized protein n=1 Tax=Apodospora peruviana TaxID=516989 RepID=A0AAE0HVV3_9PEZI|nr:hypothetical protein B0H66DRAFT_644051 [Apodospora peruviana]